MKLAVVSDIHGNLPALRAVAEEIDALRPDLVVNLGDIVSGPLWPRETAQWLIERGWPTIGGNHDRQALQARPGNDDDDALAANALTPAQRDWLAALPAELRLHGGEVVCFHGIPGDDLQGLMETVVAGYAAEGSPGCRAATVAEMRERLRGDLDRAARVLLCGHTHMPRAVMLDGRLVVNPGSLGRPAYDHDQPHPHVAETGSPHARWAWLERGRRGWQVQLRLTAYDWEASAERAAHLGFTDWAAQLRTGRAR